MDIASDAHRKKYPARIVCRPRCRGTKTGTIRLGHVAHKNALCRDPNRADGVFPVGRNNSSVFAAGAQTFTWGSHSGDWCAGHNAAAVGIHALRPALKRAPSKTNPTGDHILSETGCPAPTSLRERWLLSSRSAFPDAPDRSAIAGAHLPPLVDCSSNTVITPSRSWLQF